jgi:predicted anti-sigma-YlaC factor YlaD
MRRMALSILVLSVVAVGCSIKKVAINKLGDALAGGGVTFASDEDPELIRDAVPFSLKLIESLLIESPRHRGLLLAATSGFTQYAYAFIQQEADETEPRDITAALALKDRARKMYLRARNYGLRSLEVGHPGFEQSLRSKPESAVTAIRVSEVPILYWTAAAWGSAITISKNDPDLVADLPTVETLIDRALQLDETFDHGAIHSFLISYEMARQGVPGDSAERARKHFERAMQLSGGFQAGPFVALAEAVCIPNQDRKEFESLLNRALSIDPNNKPEYRLANLVNQRRARWLLGRVEELILSSDK